MPANKPTRPTWPACATWPCQDGLNRLATRLGTSTSRPSRRGIDTRHPLLLAAAQAVAADINTSTACCPCRALLLEAASVDPCCPNCRDQPLPMRGVRLAGRVKDRLHRNAMREAGFRNGAVTRLAPGNGWTSASDSRPCELLAAPLRPATSRVPAAAATGTRHMGLAWCAPMATSAQTNSSALLAIPACAGRSGLPRTITNGHAQACSTIVGNSGANNHQAHALPAQQQPIEATVAEFEHADRKGELEQTHESSAAELAPGPEPAPAAQAHGTLAATAGRTSRPTPRALPPPSYPAAPGRPSNDARTGLNSQQLRLAQTDTREDHRVAAGHLVVEVDADPVTPTRPWPRCWRRRSARKINEPKPPWRDGRTRPHGAGDNHCRCVIRWADAERAPAHVHAATHLADHGPSRLWRPARRRPSATGADGWNVPIPANARTTAQPRKQPPAHWSQPMTPPLR